MNHLIRFTFLFLSIIVVLVLAAGNSAKLKEKQIQRFRDNLPASIDEKLIQDFIDNIDGIAKWIQNDIIATNQQPKPFSTPSPNAPVICDLCRPAIGLIVELVRKIPDLFGLIKILLILICNILPIDGINRDVCTGAINIYADTLFFIFRENREVTALDVCGLYLGEAGGCPPISPHLRNWVVAIDQTKPPLRIDPLLPEEIGFERILHLTDIHPDLHYAVGSNTECGTPMCCRSENALPSDPAHEAGPHGSYSCDMPEQAMINAFEDAYNRSRNEGFEYKFILMTGDLVHHSVWSTNRTDNIAHFNSVNKKLVELFGATPMYPVIGNHEPHPCNMFTPSKFWSLKPEFDNSWIYNSIADVYPIFKRDAAADRMFRKAGYYSTLVNEKGGKLRLIVINSNYCYTNNFWLFYDSIDPEGQLTWLAGELLTAERAGEMVYIGGHIPPGKDDCMATWNHQFYLIVHRFENIIKAQFYGHTHNDESIIFIDPKVDPPRPFNSINIGVSTTAYTNLNPGYKIYYADGAAMEGRNQTWELLNHETYVYNLTKANIAGPNKKPEWYKLYDMKSTFGLASLRPADLYNMVLRMTTNETLFQEYVRFYEKDSDARQLCDTMDCKASHLCKTVTSDSSDHSHCERIKEILRQTPTTTPRTVVNRGESPLTAAGSVIILTGVLLSAGY